MTDHNRQPQSSRVPLPSDQSNRTPKNFFMCLPVYGLALCVLLATFYIIRLDASAPRRLEIVDEGQWLYYADALCNGQQLYRDVWYQFGPFLLYPLVAVWSILGKTLAAARAYFWVLNVVGLAAGGFALMRFTQSILLTSIGILFLEINAIICRVVMINPPFLMRQCFPLLALALACNGLRHYRSRPLWLAGIAAGTSMLLSQETGLFALFALGLAALLKGFYGNQPISQNGSAAISDAASSVGKTRIQAAVCLLGPILGGVLAPVALWLGYALLKGILPAYFTAAFLDTFAMTYEYQHIALPTWNALLGIKDGISLHGRELLNARCWFLLTYLPFLIYFYGGWEAWQRWRAQRDVSLVLLLVFTMLCWIVNTGRSDIWHAAFAAGPAIVLGLALLSRRNDRILSTHESENSTSGPIYRYAGRFITLLCLCIMVWSALFNLKMLYNIAHKGTETFTSDFPLSGGARIMKYQANRIRAVTKAVLANSEQDETLFAMPHEPMFYFFTQRKNATRFACAIFANRESYRDEIVADLKRDPPRCIILNTGGRIKGIDYEYYLEKILPLLRKYRIKKRVGTTQIRRYAGQ